MKDKQDISQYTINNKYKEYLEVLGLDENTFNDIQKVEMRRAFYAGFSDCLATINELSGKYNEKIGIQILNDFQEENIQFWKTGLIKE